MPFDPSDPFPVASSPFAVSVTSPWAGLGPPRTPGYEPLGPPMTEVPESWLNKLTRGGLGALGYLGSSLDKGFGGRAIRGLLAGKPHELLSAIPFSDSLGITNEDDRASGRDVLEHAGLLDRGTKGVFEPGDVAGFLTEIATDPSSLFAGPLTRGGMLAKKLGGLPVTRALQRGGFDLADGGLAQAARGLGQQQWGNFLGHAQDFSAAAGGIDKVKDVKPLLDALRQGLGLDVFKPQVNEVVAGAKAAIGDWRAARTAARVAAAPVGEQATRAALAAMAPHAEPYLATIAGHRPGLAPNLLTDLRQALVGGDADAARAALMPLQQAVATPSPDQASFASTALGQWLNHQAGLANVAGRQARRATLRPGLTSALGDFQARLGDLSSNLENTLLNDQGKFLPSVEEFALGGLQQQARNTLGRTLSEAPAGFSHAMTQAGEPFAQRFDLAKILGGGTIKEAEQTATPLAGLFSAKMPWWLEALGAPAARHTFFPGQGLGEVLKPVTDALAPVTNLPGIKQLLTPIQGAASLVGQGINKAAPYVRALFDSRVRGSPDAAVQDVLLGTDAARRSGEAAARGSGDQMRQWLDKLRPIASAEGIQEPELLRYLRQGMEGVPFRAPVDLVTATPADLLATRSLPPELERQIKDIADITGIKTGDVLTTAGEKAVKATDLNDLFAAYAARSRNAAGLERLKGEGLGGYLGRVGKRLLSGRDATQTARENILRDLPGGTQMIEDLVRNPQIAGPHRTLDADAVQQYLGQVIGPEHASALSAKMAAGKLTPEAAQALTDAMPKKYQQLEDFLLRSVDPLHPEKGLPYFSPDPLKDFEGRLMAGAKTAHGSDTFHELLAREMKPIKDIPLAEQVPLKAAIKDLGYTGPDYLRRTTGMLDPELATMGIDRATLDRLAATKGSFQAPAAVSPLGAAYDALQGAFKAGVTAPWPGFHVRNAASILYNLWRDDAFNPLAGKDWGALKDAFDATRGHLTPEMSQFTKELADTGLAFRRNTNQLGELAGGKNPLGQLAASSPLTPDASSLGTQTKDLLASLMPTRINPFTAEGLGGKLLQGGQQAGQTIEDTGRLLHFAQLRRQGFSPEAAAQAVEKYHFNYGDVSDFERTVMKRMVPFWKFSKSNALAVAEDLANNPGKLAATVRLADTGRAGPDDFVPRHIGEGAAIPLPGAPAGYRRFLSTLGLPIEDELIGAAAQLGQGHVQAATQRLGGMMAPLPKYAVESMTGKQLYSGRDLADLRPSLAGRLGGLLPEDSGVARDLSQILASSPASRAAGLFDKFADERKGWPETLTNLLTGVRITDVDAEKARLIEGKKTLDELLKQGGAQAFERLYLPKDQLAALPPAQQELWQLYNAMNKQAQIQSLTKKAASGDAEAAQKLARLR